MSECTDNAASRANEKAPSYSGDLPAGADVTVTLDDGSVEPLTVAPGEEFTITKFGSQTEITLTVVGGDGVEVDDFQTSCSAPLELDNVFGNLTLVSCYSKDGPVDITYSYELTKPDDPLGDVVVTDDKLGDIGIIPVLSKDESMSLESVPLSISDTTINVA